MATTPLPTPSSLFSLQGKTALVTGSTKGLGFAFAEVLLGAGASVVVNGRDSKTTEEVASGLRARLTSDSQRVIGIAADVSNPGMINRSMSNRKLLIRGSDEAVRLVKQTISELGKIDILINSKFASVIHY